MIKNTQFPFYLLLVLLMACTSSSTETANTGVTKDVSPAEFKELMADGNAIVIDVRTAAEIANGKIPDAMEIDINSPNFDSEIDGLDKEKTYLMYCKGGGRSAKACNVMKGKGFKKLYNLKGGFMAWEGEGK